MTGYQTFTYEEMKAAADVAHQMDDATLEEMAARGTFYAPTVDHNRYYIAHKDEFGYDQAVVERLNNYIGRNVETLRRAIRAQVKTAMGKDAKHLPLFSRAGAPTSSARGRACTPTGAAPARS